MSIKSRVFSYTLYSGVSIYVESFIGLFISILISRALGAEDLGVYSLMIWFSSLGITLANGGLNTAAIKFLAETQSCAKTPSGRSVFRYIFRLQMFFLPVAIVFSLLIAKQLLGNAMDEEHTLLLFAVVLAIVPKAMQVFYLSVIKGYESFKSIFFINIIVTPLNLITVIIVILADGGITQFIAAYLMITLLFFIVSWYFTRKLISSEDEIKITTPKENISDEYKYRINHFVKIATINAFLFFILDYGIEILFLSWLSNSSDAGYYTVGFRLAESVITMVPGIFSFILLPIMAKSMGEGIEILTHRFKESGRFLVIIASPFIAFGVVFAELIIETLYGQEMLPAAMPLRVLLFCSSFTMLSALALSVLLSMDRQVFIFKILFVAAILNVVLDIVLIQYFSLAGAVAASVITQIGFTLACQVLVSRILNTRLPYLEYVKIFSISYVLLIPLYVVYTMTLNIWLVLLGGGVFIMLYFFLVMYWFKLSREEVSIIHSYAEKVPVLKSIFSNKLYLWIDSRYAVKSG